MSPELMTAIRCTVNITVMCSFHLLCEDGVFGPFTKSVFCVLHAFLVGVMLLKLYLLCLYVCTLHLNLPYDVKLYSLLLVIPVWINLFTAPPAWYLSKQYILYSYFCTATFKRNMKQMFYEYESTEAIWV